MSKLYFRYGAMGSGKTIDLLKVAFNYRERNQDVIIYTAEIDDRYGVGKITTRIGIQSDALTFNRETNFYREIKQVENWEKNNFEEMMFNLLWSSCRFSNEFF